MIVLVYKYLTPKWVSGIAIFPFIIVTDERNKKNAIFLNHERIHLKQQMELLIIPFFVFYFLEFLIRYIIYKNWNKAYMNISFEREAYKNEKDLNYIKKRSIWAFINYFN